MIRSCLAGFMLVSATVHAGAAGIEELLKGVYLGSEELCAQAKKDGIQKVVEGGNVMLSIRGLESVEYNCEFLQATKATRSPAWAVTAICQEPGYVFPDVLSLVEMSPKQIDIVSVIPGDDENPGNSGSYYLCDGVAMP